MSRIFRMPIVNARSGLLTQHAAADNMVNGVPQCGNHGTKTIFTIFDNYLYYFLTSTFTF